MLVFCGDTITTSPHLLGSAGNRVTNCTCDTRLARAVFHGKSTSPEHPTATTPSTRISLILGIGWSIQVYCGAGLSDQNARDIFIGATSRLLSTEQPFHEA